VFFAASAAAGAVLSDTMPSNVALCAVPVSRLNSKMLILINLGLIKDTWLTLL